MTNGEKFRAVVDRAYQFKLFCESQKHGCNDCKLKDCAGDGCRYAWLELEYKAELKPCPFCGGEAVLYVGECSFVKCHSCDAESFHGELLDEVVSAWNRRV